MLLRMRSEFGFLYILLIFSSFPLARQLSDSAFIEGHFSQNGVSLSRRQVERFLLDQKNTSAVLADGSKGYRLSSWAVGVPMWCISTGITVYQLKMFVDAMERMEPVNTNINRLTVPLLIGSEVTTFVQGLLSSRSEYLLHKSIISFNENVASNSGSNHQVDRSIVKVKSGWYTQGRVMIPEGILNQVLWGKNESRPFGLWSGVTRFTADQTIGIGVMFLFLAALAYIEPETVDVHTRDLRLGLGIGLTGFGITNSILSSVFRKIGIKKYNAASLKQQPSVPIPSRPE